jgi:pyridoxal phosphate enzyme (YggS family)
MASGADIAAALARVQERIAEATARVGRPPNSVRLVAVSKTRPPEDVRAALSAGQRAFAENYAQELRDKSRALADCDPPPQWHFIGPLQRNKVKYVVGTAALVHAVESIELAGEIDRRAAALGVWQDVLVEVNVAGEQQKHGVAPAALGELLAQLAKLDHIRCRGLMTMAPLGSDPEPSRPHFRALRRLAEGAGLPELSMGMTQDLEVAVEEGATLVRVGTAIFGERSKI